MTTRAYIALGSNLGDPLATVQAAFAALRTLPETTLVAASSLYRSAPVGLKHQPDFINAVAAADTALGAEARCGRRGDFRRAPRSLDRDLLLYGSERRRGAQLTLPHPRMHERAFVLLPLLELAPDIAIPGRGPARDLMSACREQKLAKLAIIPAVFDTESQRPCATLRIHVR